MAPYDVVSNISEALNLGPGEEKRYITTWGMAFLLNTFGLESLQIIGRGLHSSTIRLIVNTFCDIRWVHDVPPVS